jgi:hypothetical protein
MALGVFFGKARRRQKIFLKSERKLQLCCFSKKARRCLKFFLEFCEEIGLFVVFAETSQMRPKFFDFANFLFRLRARRFFIRGKEICELAGFLLSRNLRARRFFIERKSASRQTGV